MKDFQSTSLTSEVVEEELGEVSWLSSRKLACQCVIRTQTKLEGLTVADGEPQW